jgi:hypothetical protein|tara:strand:+ start:268 stop:735 length:468 start_codon:yes stop_codon:yes gene_type:complete
MSYLNVISLDQAKQYLRIDDELSADDAQIEQMIKGALSTLERRTNILFYARKKKYIFQDYSVKVYDYPINEVVSTFDVDTEQKTLFTNYQTNSSDNEIVLMVGFENAEDVPSELVDCALQYIKYLYYEAETNTANKGGLPAWLNDMINQNKRFIF